jgi:hypothetical protein
MSSLSWLQGLQQRLTGVNCNRQSTCCVFSACLQPMLDSHQVYTAASAKCVPPHSQRNRLLQQAVILSYLPMRHLAPAPPAPLAPPPSLPPPPRVLCCAVLCRAWRGHQRRAAHRGAHA